MAFLNDINIKLNEFKTLLDACKNDFPDNFDMQKKQLNMIIDFTTDRLSSKYSLLLNQGELDQIFNTISVMVSEILNFKNSKNQAYISRAVNQIVNLKNLLNLIPIENLDKSQIKDLTKEINQTKSEQDKIITDNIKKLTALENKGQELIFKSANLLSNTTTDALSKQFEEKRKEENGGMKYITYWKKEKIKKWGNYQRTSFGFFGILILIITIFLFSDRFIELLFSIKPEELNQTATIIARLLTKITMSAPLVWLAIVQNKKMNLSKKLAEEYWHKEIVAKTFVGLSEQIDKNTEGDTAKDLRIKLLDITLDTIGKNPADCIDNQDNSDHPVTNILKYTDKKLEKANTLLTTANNAKDLLK